MSDLNTHDVLMPSGKHKGERLTRVPVSYLKWMANESGHSMRDLANAEIKRRGHVMPTIELSAHAIDNASLRVRKIWHETKLNEDEGLYTWLVRMVTEAMQSPSADGVYYHHGMKLVVAQGEEFPTLKTVTRGKTRVATDAAS